MVDTEDRTPQEDTPPVHGREQVREREAVQGGSGHVDGEFDRDVNIKAIVWSGAILTGVTALSFVLMWYLFQGMKSSHEARDPRPMPISEAAEPVQPPGPRLQSTPEEDLARMLRQEEALLESYSLLDGEEGFIRIPVERAMELALEQGLGQPAGDDGMSSDEESVEASGSPTEPAGGPADGSASEGTPSHSPEPTRSR